MPRGEESDLFRQVIVGMQAMKLDELPGSTDPFGQEICWSAD